ncbi:hypothetical protein [Dokdonella sp.]|uniref:hypothetical protein n=1 Tax=Dokdonella sp. TaxID=2291710 RepID=UPI003C659CC3
MEFADGIETARTLQVDGISVDTEDDYYLERYRVAALPNGQLSQTSLKNNTLYSPPELIETRIDGSAFHLPADPCTTAARSAMA